MADMNVSHVSKQVTTEVKPASAKKEFEQLIRSIRKIAASSRAFSGEFINSLLKESEKSAEGKRNLSVGGSAAQVISVALAYMSGEKDPKKFASTLKVALKLGDAGSSVASAMQFGHQADEQRIQQTLTHYNTFERNMGSLIENMNAINNQIRQKEMEQN